MTRRLLQIACVTVLMWTDTAFASPFEWHVVALRYASMAVVADSELSVDPFSRRFSQSPQSLGASRLGGGAVSIALLDSGGRSHWAVRPTAVFIPDSGATTFLEQLVQPGSEGPSLAPTPSDPGHLQPVPARETRASPLPPPPSVGRTTIRYHGDAAAMLPLSLGFLGLVVGGRRPKPRPAAGS